MSRFCPDLTHHDTVVCLCISNNRYFIDNGLTNIFLVTPQTADERIRKIDELSDSFIYLLSSASITGKALDLNDTVDTYFKRIEDMELRKPTIVGFGIAGKAAFDKACQYNRGAIVGSAFVKYLNNTKDYLAGIPEFIGQFRG